MKNSLFYTFVGLTLFAGMAACSDQPKNERTDTFSSGAISFASDESFSPIIDEQIQVFEHDYPNAKVTPIYTNELDGVNMLMKDSIRLVITSRQFTQDELKFLRDKTYRPVSIPFAYDGLSLIINRANTDSCISLKNIKRVLRGEATSWSDIVPDSKRGDILVVFDNKQSSTVHYCVDSLLDGKPIDSPNIMAAKTSKEVIDYVEQTPNAIGIIGSNWLNDNRDTTNTTFKKNITVMSVSVFDNATPMNSWKPYQAYLYDGRYPLVRTLYALLNDPRNGLPWGFAHFLECPKGQLIIFKSGLLPANAQVSIRPVIVGNE
ncbi:MAG: substrate-binding domain-containing protein [Prevotella sp.]|nr:substrate-binding domain-containing protein [Prevotella sp.]